MEFQVTFDANDPAKLADFWQVALDYKRDDPPNGFDTWDAFLKEAGVPEEKWNDADAIVPSNGSGPRIYFQKVPEGKVAKNRIHLDLRAAHGLKDIERMIALEKKAVLLEGIGASRIRRVDADGLNVGFIVMADPEGNEFCLD